MTQYLLSVWGDETTIPDPAEMTETYAKVDVFNNEIQESGAWVFAGGLHPTSTATVVDGRGSEPVTTDGPYAETKEQMGGFWVVEAPDLDAALELARRGSAACGAPVEVRPFQDEPDA